MVQKSIPFQEDREFYTFEQEHFDPAVIKKYWRKQFADSFVGSRGFSQDVKGFLSAGLGLEELCSIARRKDAA